MYIAVYFSSGNREMTRKLAGRSAQPSTGNYLLVLMSVLSNDTVNCEIALLS